MSAKTLRQAATLMRTRAKACISTEPSTGEELPWFIPEAFTSRKWTDADDASHIASWDPTVALAVSEWLSEEASCMEQADAEFERRSQNTRNRDIAAHNYFHASYTRSSEYKHRRALAVARAYLKDPE